MTLQILINRFLNDQRRSGKSVLSLSAYATDLKQFLSLLSSLPFFSLSPAGLKTVCQKWTAKLAPNAAARKLTTLRSFLKWSFQKGYIKKDLSASVFRPKRRTVTVVKPLTASQIARLRRTATLQERLLLELLLATGMRLAEVLSLKMKHINLRKFSIQYSPASPPDLVSRPRLDSVEDGSTRSRTGRLGRGRAVFSIIPVNEYLRQALDYYLAAVTRGPRSYLLVSPKTGRPPGVRAAGMMLSKLGKRAGVKGATPRNLRATFRNGT